MTSTKTGILTIVDQANLMVNLGCTYPPCNKYNSLSDLYLNASLENSIATTITWDFTMNISLPFQSFQNTFFFNQDTSAYSNQVLQISVTASVNGKLGSAKFFIPINGPPTGGVVTVSPATGYALVTSFSISSTGWYDTDLPLNYQFFADLPQGKISLSGIQSKNSTESYLSGDYQS
jgi:hypothetical protein